jgi:hypothetical protein
MKINMAGRAFCIFYTAIMVAFLVYFLRCPDWRFRDIDQIAPKEHLKSDLDTLCAMVGTGSMYEIEGRHKYFPTTVGPRRLPFSAAILGLLNQTHELPRYLHDNFPSLEVSVGPWSLGISPDQTYGRGAPFGFTSLDIPRHDYAYWQDSLGLGIFQPEAAQFLTTRQFEDLGYGYWIKDSLSDFPFSIQLAFPGVNALIWAHTTKEHEVVHGKIWIPGKSASREFWLTRTARFAQEEPLDSAN